MRNDNGIDLRNCSRRSRWIEFPVFFTALLVLFALNLALRWPGSLTPDSISQLAQARGGHFTDWHPPIMAMLWRAMLPFESGMFVLQVAIHWFGIGALGERLRRDRLHKWAYLMLASGLTPIALKYTGVVQKDSLLASCFIASAGFLALRLRGPAVLIAAVGTLSRVNGVFASPSLFVRGPLAPLLGAVIAIALIPVSMTLNRLVASPSGVERSLQLYDLTGIAYYSGDTSILPVPIPNLKGCYTPLFWDTLGSARCGKAFQRLNRDITGNWVRGIFNHPLSYAEHRFSQFNRGIFFIVPPRQQCVEAPEFHDCPQGLEKDYLEKNALLWPVTWLALGLAMLSSNLKPLPRSLTLSGLMYGFAYLFVGVAADFRYFYWTELAVQSALLFHIASRGPWKRLLVFVAPVIAAGYVARALL